MNRIFWLRIAVYTALFLGNVGLWILILQGFKLWIEWR